MVTWLLHGAVVLEFKVERSGKTLAGSAASGEGLSECLSWNRKGFDCTS